MRKSDGPDNSAISLVTIGGGYVKAILRGGEETVIGRDFGELVGRLRRIGFRDPLPIAEKKEVVRAQTQREATE